MLALKNLFRRKIRSLLTIVGVGVGIATVVTMVAVARGFRQQFNDFFAAGNAHLVLTRKGAADPFISYLPDTLLDRMVKVDNVLEAHPVVLPDVLVEHEVRGRLEELVRNLMQQGMDPEKAQLDWKEIRENQEEPARKSVHARLLLDAIAKAESIEANPDEFQQRIERDAASMGQKPEEVLAHLDKGPGRQVIIDQILREKSLDLVQGSANIRTEE